MGRACDTTMNDVLNHPHGHIVMMVSGPKGLVIVRMVQAETVETDGLNASNSRDGSHLRVVVQWA